MLPKRLQVAPVHAWTPPQSVARGIEPHLPAVTSSAFRAIVRVSPPFSRQPTRPVGHARHIGAPNPIYPHGTASRVAAQDYRGLPLSPQKAIGQHERGGFGSDGATAPDTGRGSVRFSMIPGLAPGASPLILSRRQTVSGGSVRGSQWPELDNPVPHRCAHCGDAPALLSTMLIEHADSRKGLLLTLAPDWARVTLVGMKTLVEIGALLRQERQNQEISRDALAKTSGVSKRTIGRIETGRSVASEALFAMVRALGLSLVEHGEPAAHYVVVAREKDSKTWNGLGHAHTRPDGSLDVFVPLLNRHLFLRPVPTAAEAKAWPVTADERDVWPAREGL